MRVPTGISTAPASRLMRSPELASHSTSLSLNTLKMNKTLRTAPSPTSDVRRVYRQGKGLPAGPRMPGRLCGIFSCVAVDGGATVGA